MKTIQIQIPEVDLKKETFQTFEELFFELKKNKKIRFKKNIFSYWNDEEIDSLGKTAYNSNSF